MFPDPSALINLALYVPEAAAPAVLDQMLGICARSSPWIQVQALSEAAPHLPPVQRRQAVQLAAELPDPRHRYQALASLALGADPPVRLEILALITDAVRDIESHGWTALEAVPLASHLPEPERGQILTQALSEITQIDSTAKRADELARLAPYLEGDLLIDALELAKQIKDASNRTRLLRALALTSLGLSPRVSQV